MIMIRLKPGWTITNNFFNLKRGEMGKKRKSLTISLALAIIGIVLLTVDRLTASADSMSHFGQSFTVITIIALFFLMVAAIWFYKMTFD